MMTIIPEPITAQGFAPFGTLIEAGTMVPTEAGRAATQTIIERKVVSPPAAPHVINRLERHPKDSQAFLPLGGSPYLIIVCSGRADGTPDDAGLRAFHVPGSLGIQYRAGTWHADMTALSGSREMVIIMDRDFGPGDIEIHPLDAPVEILLQRPVRPSGHQPETRP